MIKKIDKTIFLSNNFIVFGIFSDLSTSFGVTVAVYMLNDLD